MAIRFSIFPPSGPSHPCVIAFDLEKIVVGRGSVCDLRLPHPAVSFHHATVEVDGARYTVRDEGSTNGTIVNGARIPASYRHRIHSDDVIEIGGFKLVPTLSVPMEGTHSDERTEAMARSLLEMDATDLEEAALTVTSGPDSGTILELPRTGKDMYSVGAAADCDLRLSDPAIRTSRIELRRSIRGWVMTSPGQDVRVNAQSRTEARLADGHTISAGDTVMRLSDPVDALYSRLLRERSDMECDVFAPSTGQRQPALFTPPPERAGDEATTRPDPPPPAADAVLSGRSQSPTPRGSTARLPEYSWMVITVGVIAFLASIALLLVLMF